METSDLINRPQEMENENLSAEICHLSCDQLDEVLFKEKPFDPDNEESSMNQEEEEKPKSFVLEEINSERAQLILQDKSNDDADERTQNKRKEGIPENNFESQQSIHQSIGDADIDSKPLRSDVNPQNNNHSNNDNSTRNVSSNKEQSYEQQTTKEPSSNNGWGITAKPESQSSNVTTGGWGNSTNANQENIKVPGTEVSEAKPSSNTGGWGTNESSENTSTTTTTAGGWGSSSSTNTTTGGWGSSGGTNNSTTEGGWGSTSTGGTEGRFNNNRNFNNNNNGGGGYRKFDRNNNNNEGGESGNDGGQRRFNNNRNINRDGENNNGNGGGWNRNRNGDKNNDNNNRGGYQKRNNFNTKTNSKEGKSSWGAGDSSFGTSTGGASESTGAWGSTSTETKQESSSSGWGSSSNQTKTDSNQGWGSEPKEQFKTGGTWGNSSSITNNESSASGGGGWGQKANNPSTNNSNNNASSSGWGSSNSTGGETNTSGQGRKWGNSENNTGENKRSWGEKKQDGNSSWGNRGESGNNRNNQDGQRQNFRGNNNSTFGNTNNNNNSSSDTWGGADANQKKSSSVEGGWNASDKTVGGSDAVDKDQPSGSGWNASSISNEDKLLTKRTKDPRLQEKGIRQSNNINLNGMDDVEVEERIFGTKRLKKNDSEVKDNYSSVTKEKQAQFIDLEKDDDNIFVRFSPSDNRDKEYHPTGLPTSDDISIGSFTKLISKTSGNEFDDDDDSDIVEVISNPQRMKESQLKKYSSFSSYFSQYKKYLTQRESILGDIEQKVPFQLYNDKLSFLLPEETKKYNVMTQFNTFMTHDEFRFLPLISTRNKINQQELGFLNYDAAIVMIKNIQIQETNERRTIFLSWVESSIPSQHAHLNKLANYLLDKNLIAGYNYTNHATINLMHIRQIFPDMQYLTLPDLSDNQKTSLICLVTLEASIYDAFCQKIVAYE